MSNIQSHKHSPVLLREAIDGLNIQKKKRYIDATLGSGGHALEIIKKGGLLLGIDQDPEAVERTKKRLEKVYPEFGQRACPVLYQKVKNQSKNEIKSNYFQPTFCVGTFSKLEQIADNLGFNRPAGILFDLGVSSEQLASLKKGLSFSINAPLDMRLDPTLSKSAKDVINELKEEELYEIFTRNAQEELARPIAQSIVSARRLKPIETTDELARIISQVKKNRKAKIHPATKVFLALRIEVNNEIENLKKGLSQAIKILDQKGRLVVISFHQTEDRIVKQSLKKAATVNQLTVLNKKPIVPTKNEIIKNPRSRSAKLRIAQKL